MAKKNRSLKVVGQSGYQYRETPCIMLKGKWLKELGFQIGDYVSVSCEDGKMVITLDQEKAEIIEAEKAFMERETESLKKKFQEEKTRIHTQYVAEREARYGVCEKTN